MGHQSTSKCMETITECTFIARTLFAFCSFITHFSSLSVHCEVFLWICVFVGNRKWNPDRSWGRWYHKLRLYWSFCLSCIVYKKKNYLRFVLPGRRHTFFSHSGKASPSASSSGASLAAPKLAKSIYPFKGISVSHTYTHKHTPAVHTSTPIVVDSRKCRWPPFGWRAMCFGNRFARTWPPPTPPRQKTNSMVDENTAYFNWLDAQFNPSSPEKVASCAVGGAIRLRPSNASDCVAEDALNKRIGGWMEGTKRQ